MTTLYACALTAVIVYSAGWCHGHRTARIRHAPMWACARCDTVALTADEQAAFRQVEDHFDDWPEPAPDHDQPGSSAA